MKSKFSIVFFSLMTMFFFIWFIPFWWEGLTKSGSSQLCHLNESAKNRHFEGEIKSFHSVKGHGGIVELVFMDGFKHAFPRWMLYEFRDKIHTGQIVAKAKGDLFFMITDKVDTFRVSMDHGCIDK